MSAPRERRGADDIHVELSRDRIRFSGPPTLGFVAVVGVISLALLLAWFAFCLTF